MDKHPITPPPELVQQWATASPVQSSDENWAYEMFIAHHAAQWGANQELEACCNWVAVESIAAATELRSWRRPKPPSLKEQALNGLEKVLRLVNLAELVFLMSTKPMLITSAAHWRHYLND
jgi:hypothetical protein